MRKFLSALCLAVFANVAAGQTVTPVDKLNAEEISKALANKAIVVVAVNWNRHWKCGRYENAQLRSIGFDRLSATARAADAPADLLLDDAPLLLTKPGFDSYAFVVEPGVYAISSFDIKVASSMHDTGGFKSNRSQLIRDGKALGGNFEVHAGEIDYIGHFYLDCLGQPIPWRFYPDGEDAFREYVGGLKSRFPGVDMGRVQFKLFRTSQFGNDYYQDIGIRAEAKGNWVLAEENYQRGYLESQGDFVADADRSRATYNLARARGYLCKFEDAEKLMAAALDIEEKVSGPESGVISKRLIESARLHFDRGEFDKSIPFFARGMPMLANLGVAKIDPIGLANTYDDYASALTHTGKNAEADAAKQEADRLREANPGRAARYVPARYGQSCPAK